MQFAGFVSLALFAAPALAAPNSLMVVNTFAGEKTGRFIVRLKSDVSRAASMSSVKSFSSSVDITHEWNLINGFAGNFDEDTLNSLRSNPDVESISEDGVMHIAAAVEQTDAPWGLSRLSQDGPTGGTADETDFTYTYDDSAGEGVDIYIIDTGIRTTHNDFGGRAQWGATFGGYEDADGHGHGTHCAGTAASTTWGVAKAANLFAVKVLDDEGSGNIADIISGLDFVGEQAAATGNPTVASLSLGGGASRAIDDAVEALTAAGIHVVVAAGNENVDAGSSSPARAPSAITVGATDITDTRAEFSNFGDVVDIFAPGVDIISTWATSDDAAFSISGTSMATPHVAGLVAYLIGVNGNDTPEAISETLKNLGVSGAVSDIPPGTTDVLARNGI